MWVVFDQPKWFVSAVNICASFLDDVRIKAEDGKLEINELDPTRICWIGAEFEPEIQRPGEIYVNVHELKRVLKFVKDNLILRTHENRLEIKSDNTSFKIPILPELEKEEKPQEGLEYKCMASLQVKLLKEAIKRAEIVSDELEIHVKGTRLVFKAESDLGEMTYDVSEDCAVQGEEDVVSRYTLSYLRDFVRHLPNDREIDLGLRTDYPLKALMIFNEFDSIKFILAPRIRD